MLDNTEEDKDKNLGEFKPISEMQRILYLNGYVKELQGMVKTLLDSEQSAVDCLKELVQTVKHLDLNPSARTLMNIREELAHTKRKNSKNKLEREIVENKYHKLQQEHFQTKKRLSAAQSELEGCIK